MIIFILYNIKDCKVSVTLKLESYVSSVKMWLSLSILCSLFAVYSSGKETKLGLFILKGIFKN